MWPFIVACGMAMLLGSSEVVGRWAFRCSSFLSSVRDKIENGVTRAVTSDNLLSYLHQDETVPCSFVCPSSPSLLASGPVLITNSMPGWAYFYSDGRTDGQTCNTFIKPTPYQWLAIIPSQTCRTRDETQQRAQYNPGLLIPISFERKILVICKTPTFWFEGVHPSDGLRVYALPKAIPGRWGSNTIPESPMWVSWYFTCRLCLPQQHREEMCLQPGQTRL